MRKLLNALSWAACIILLNGCRNETESAAPVELDISSQTYVTTLTEETTTETETTAPRIRNLVTFGDSISAGYGLEHPEAQRYSALLVQKLADDEGISWNDYNYAVSGDDSSDLLNLLEDGKARSLPEADMICLYIGANNLLGPYTDYLKSVSQIFRKPDGETGVAAWIGSITSAVSSNIQSFTEINEKVDEGMERLTKDLPDTYNRIRQMNADAPIFLMTVYNPYKYVSFSNPVTKESFGVYTGEKIDRLNDIIRSFKASHPDITLVDIHDAFEKLEKVPILGNINEGISSEQKASVDPHPNAEGQRVIADTVFAARRSAK